jgi:hypothetical protein
MVGRRGRNPGSTEVIRFGKSWEAAIQRDKLANRWAEDAAING